MSDVKARHRAQLLALRRALPADLTVAAARSITNRLTSLSIFETAPAVLLYSAAPDEVGTELLRQAANEAGKPVYYPRPAEDARLDFVRAGPGECLRPGRWRLGEPAGSIIFEAGQPGLLIVPGVAFDRDGNRLGRGGGYYDRAIARLRPPVVAVGLAFSAQIVPALPRFAWDEPMDVVVTESDTIHGPVGISRSGRAADPCSRTSEGTP